MSDEPGWYRDPTNRFAFRYWDGTRWTPQVGSGQSTGGDPEPLDPTVSAMPPAPGTAAEEVRPQATSPTVTASRSGRGGRSAGVVAAMAVVVAIVVLAVVLLGSGGERDTTEGPSPTDGPSEPAPTDPPPEQTSIT